MNLKYIGLKISLLFSCFSTLQLQAQQVDIPKRVWVDSVYNTLSRSQKIGQLFMVAAYSGGAKMNRDWVQNQIDSFHIGGLIFMQGTPEAQAIQTNHFQRTSNIPLLIGMDAEWGLGMRLTGIKDLAKQMTIGASRDTALMYELGTAIAKQCKRLGVHINFAPCIDINNNPKNPVIGFRSFGADKALVATLGITYTNVLQDNNIMACAKHFPGHGDVTIDSHEDLPLIPKSKNEMAELELYPFQKLIDNGIQSVMIAHLNLPKLDHQGIPSTLSYPIVTDLLRNEMHFDGLIFTDALNMKGMTNYFTDGDIEVKAFLAGNDVLLFSQDVRKGIDKLMAAYDAGVLTEARLAQSVKKILGAKYDKKLHQFQAIDSTHITVDLNKDYDAVMEKVAAKSITLYKGKVPDSKVANNKHVITYNATKEQLQFYKKSFPNASIYNIEKETPKAESATYFKSISKTSDVYVFLHKLSRYPGSNDYYGFSEPQIASLRSLSYDANTYFVVYGVPYMAQNFCQASNVVIAYEDHPAFQQQVVNIIQNKQHATGQPPVNICN